MEDILAARGEQVRRVGLRERLDDDDGDEEGGRRRRHLLQEGQFEVVPK